MALIPDTQRCVRYNPAMFLAQTHWLEAQRARLNLKFAIHLGAVVDHNTHRERARQIRPWLRPTATCCISC